MTKIYKNYAGKSMPAGNHLKLVQLPSLGIVARCQVYCSKIVHTDYPIKIQHFRIICTKQHQQSFALVYLSLYNSYVQTVLAGFKHFIFCSSLPCYVFKFWSNTGKSVRDFPVLHFLPLFDFISHFYQLFLVYCLTAMYFQQTIM